MNGIDRIRDFLATVFDTNHSKIENPGNSDQKPPYAVPSTEQDNPSDVAFSCQESDGTASAEKDTHDNPTEQEQLVAEPPKYPTKEDGTPDYDNMTPQQEYDYMAETFGEKTAQEQAQAYVDSYQDAVRNIQAQLNNKKVIRSRAAMLDQLKENKPLLEAWRALLKEQPPATETQQKSPIPDCPTALSERFKHPRILFYASRIQQWRNDIQNATSDSERDMLQIKLHYRTRWWKRSILDLICDPILSAEYDSVVDSLDWDDLTEAEQWQAEVREATLSVMRKKEKGEMYKHAMNLLRNTESSDLERLVAETVIEAIEQDEKESYENDILPRLKKLDGVSDITMNSGISVRPSRKGEIMELVHVVEASVPAEAETDFLCEMETAADILMPDRFSISLEETVKTSDNQKKVKTTQLDPNFNELRYFMDEGATIRFAFDAETKNTIRFKELIDGDSDIPKMGTIYINKSLLQEIGYDPNYWLYVTLQHYVI